jgi:hypothetical protein
MSDSLYNLLIKILNNLDRDDYNMGSHAAREMLAKKIVEGINNEKST